MAITCELAQRTAIRAFRVEQRVLVVAEGELPDPSYEAKITQRPERIFPPWYQVLSCPRVGVFPDVIAPYRVSRTVECPEERSTITVFHADGEDDVTIEACGDELSAYSEIVAGAARAGARRDGADEATGFSKKLSFDERPPTRSRGCPRSSLTIRSRWRPYASSRSAGCSAGSPASTTSTSRFPAPTIDAVPLCGALCPRRYSER